MTTDNILAEFNNQNKIRNMLILFKAKLSDQRLKFVDLTRGKQNQDIKDIAWYNIGVLNIHIERCSQLIQSKHIEDLNSEISKGKFSEMVLSGRYNGKRVELDIKNMKRIKTIKSTKIIEET